MPAQAMTRFEKTGVKSCPHCKEFPIEVYSLQLRVCDVEGFEHTEGHLACLACLLGSGERTIARMLKVSDVIKTSRTPQKNMLKRVRRQERETANSIDGRTTPASGSGIAKGDIRNSEWFGENKSSFRGDSSYRLTGETMLKTLHQAQKLGLRPFVQVRLQKAKLDLVVLLWQDFLEAIHDHD